MTHPAVTAAIDHFAALAKDSELARLACALAGAVDARDAESITQCTIKIRTVVMNDPILRPYAEAAAETIRMVNQRNAERN